MSQLELLTPKEHFKEKITSASRDLKIEMNPELEFYLVTLLCDFIKPPEELSLDTPLAFMLKDATESAEDEQTKHLKHLGDTALYLSGFFQDFFNKKTYDIRYYISMGSSAYFKLSDVVSGTSEKLYKNLGEEFSNLVEVVASIADEVAVGRDVNLLATYDRWTKTKSSRLRKILEKEGITPVNVKMTRAQ